ncbi:YaaL family protein [Bacillus infantis]|uniref:YaaL family protein n=1 Tax=Bacillus infantis TaxID=324767 RepID=UPI003CEE75D3
MFFRKKGRLRNEFDEQLLGQLNSLKDEWYNQKRLLEKSFDPSAEVLAQTKLAEAKYFYLFKEAKARKISVR